MRNKWGVINKAWWLILVVFLSGCFLWPWGGGPRERVVELSFNAPGGLNHDGRDPNTLEVIVFVLADTVNFRNGQVGAIFDSTSNPDYYDQFAADIVGKWALTVWPGKSQTLTIDYTIQASGPKRVFLGVIGDFFQAPEGGRERRIFMLRNKSSQRLTVQLGENSIQPIIRR